MPAREKRPRTRRGKAREFQPSSMPVPGAWCQVCRTKPICSYLGEYRLHPDYPTCRVPLRSVDGQRLEQLLERLVKLSGCHDDRVQKFLTQIFDHSLRNSRYYSEILEFSLSLVAGDSPEWLRLSYALPGYRKDTMDGLQFVLQAFSTLLGNKHADWGKQLMDIALHPAVEQPIVGIAWKNASSWRLKFYLQFLGDSSAKALEIIRRLTGYDPRRSLVAPRGKLHMLGLDIGGRGLRGIKLYWLIDRLWIDDNIPQLHLPTSCRSPLWSRLLDNVLIIQRVEEPTSYRLRHPLEVDFSLLENEMPWHLLAAERPSLLRPLLDDMTWQELLASFALAPRRISMTAAARPRINLYYVLVERTGE